MESLDSVTETPRLGVPQHVLRRLSGRALHVITRHADKHGAIATYQDTFAPVAEAYIAAYDRIRSSDPERTREAAESGQATQALLRTVRAWGAHLERDIVGLDLGAFRPNAGAQDDLIHATVQLLETLANIQASETEALTYGEKVMADVEQALEAAKKERLEAQDMMASDQEARAEVRRLAHEVQAGLVRLRKTLRAILGSRHRDYQKLRQNRGSVVDAEDPEVETGAAEPGTKVVPPEDSTAEAQVPVMEDEDGEAAE